MKNCTAEYLMELKLHKGARIPENMSFSHCKTERVRVYDLGKEKPEYLGVFRLLPYSDGRTVYFYEFELSRGKRGMGLGKRLFPFILSYLYSLGYRKVRLQVSGSNQAALSIYKKCGFEVIETAFSE